LNPLWVIAFDPITK
jgi:hypothetical protein